MSKKITLSIDVSKINKEKIYKGKVGTWLNLDCWIDEDATEDWKKVSLSQSLSKEEKDAGEKRNYVGGGKLAYGWDESSEPSGGSSVTDEEIPF